MTVREFIAILDPAMTAAQLSTLITIADIQPCGTRHTGKPGRPALTYDVAAIMRAHGDETRRTIKQFTDNDWIGAALLGRHLIRVDAEAGVIRWHNGHRAETLGAGNYGYVYAGRERTPAHRIIWTAAEGEIPPPMQVNHINRRRWDNRRANLELVSFGNNIRHAHGAPYINYQDAVRELAVLPAHTDTINP